MGKKASILVVGAGFIGVEWATEIEYFFPDVQLTIIDGLPRALGPLPDSAAEYCSEYMNAAGIKEFYSKMYAGDKQEFWDSIEVTKKDGTVWGDGTVFAVGDCNLGYQGDLKDPE